MALHVSRVSQGAWFGVRGRRSLRAWARHSASSLKGQRVTQCLRRSQFALWKCALHRNYESAVCSAWRTESVGVCFCCEASVPQ
eukprot:4607775-Pyramimonas_sp.AAC.1